MDTTATGGSVTYLGRRKTESVRLDSVEWGWLGIKGTWVADREQQTAAWEMYVELITRIAIQPLGDDEGLDREALSSLYSLFSETRRILKTHGPSVAEPVKKGTVSFGQLAVLVLNKLLRPFLSKWHPQLSAHEASRPANVSQLQHERNWNDQHQKFREELRELARRLRQYAALLAEAAGIEPIA